MQRTLLISALAAASALAVTAAPGAASAACSDRKAVGTVVGGVGGALLGNSISKGGGGAVIGGLGGAFLGHEVAKSGCRSSYRTSSAPTRYRSSSRTRSYAAAEPAPPPVRYVYYDQYGQPVSGGPAPTAVAYSGACRTEMRGYYDDRGRLVQRPVQVCDR
jgi:hypothetical protein